MAVGDDATNNGMPLVPDSGEDGKVKWGAREINRTRDYIGQLRATLGIKADNRSRAGISSGTALPSGGADGDIYFRIL